MMKEMCYSCHGYDWPNAFTDARCRACHKEYLQEEAKNLPAKVIKVVRQTNGEWFACFDGVDGVFDYGRSIGEAVGSVIRNNQKLFNIKVDVDNDSVKNGP